MDISDRDHLNRILQLAAQEDEQFALRAYESLKVIHEERTKAIIAALLSHAVVFLAVFDVLSAAALLKIDAKSPYLIPSALILAAYTYYRFGLVQLKQGYFEFFFNLRLEGKSEAEVARSLLLMPHTRMATGFTIPGLISRRYTISIAWATRSAFFLLSTWTLTTSVLLGWGYTLYMIWISNDPNAVLRHAAVIIYGIVFASVNALYGKRTWNGYRPEV